MLSMSIVRRRASLAVVAVLALLGLTMAMSLQTTAVAGPAYPPKAPCSVGQTSTPGSSSTTCTPTAAVKAQTTHRNTDGSNNGPTANTGFAAVTASVIAVALLGGGLVLLFVGRRRRQT